MAHIFCTYFDNGYLTRGMVLYRSLERCDPSFTLWVLCLDDVCHRALVEHKNSRIKPISLQELQAIDPEFAQAQHNRSRIEYYFTSTPVLLSYVLARSPRAAMVTYLDADLYFFGSPEPLLAELVDASCGLIEHRFAERVAKLKCRGIYNVGWVSLRNDPIGLDCAAWWRERCLDWCHDRVEDGRFADQKYLDLVPAKFPKVKVLDQPGANLAPWNMERHRVVLRDRQLLVDSQPLIFFHFHGVRQIARELWAANFASFGHKPDPALLEHVYGRYMQALRVEADALGTALPTDRPKIWAPGRGAYLAVREILSPRFVLEVMRGRIVLFWREAPLGLRRRPRRLQPSIPTETRPASTAPGN
jgi:hypothetical protein